MKYGVMRNGIYVAVAQPTPLPNQQKESPMTRVSKPEPDPVLIEGRIVRETEKAVLFNVRVVNGRSIENPRNEWFPISQMKSRTIAAPPKDPYQDPEEDELDTMKMSHWICQTKGLV